MSYHFFWRYVMQTISMQTKVELLRKIFKATWCCFIFFFYVNQVFGQLQTPQLISPYDSEYLNTAISVKMTWDPVPNAVRYKVRIGIDPLVSKAIIYDTVCSTSWRIFDSLAPNTQYYWRIKAIAANGTTSAWSTVRTFYTADTSSMNLGIIQRTYPKDGDIVSTQISQLSWKPVPGANYYKVSVSADPLGVQTIVFDTNCRIPSYQLPSMSVGTTLYWRIKPVFRFGLQYRSGTWTTPRWKFQITGSSSTTPAPSTNISLISPNSGSIINASPILLSWSNVSGAQRYHIQVATAANFTPQSLIFQDSTKVSTSVQTPALTMGKMYYWRARVRTTTGWGQWTPIRNFLRAMTDNFSQQFPLVFVTQIPTSGFTSVGEPFANHKPSTFYTPRGGDLMIRYPNGTEKNITRLAGYGESGESQISNKSIAVRDPAVSWDGTKIIFSMVIGEKKSFNDNNNYVWQLYEATQLGENQTPIITKINAQPAMYNNISPAYGTNGCIIFTSDRPRNGEPHLYPQLDEYELTDVNSGLWSLNPSTGDLKLLDHAPSGDYTPSIDSYGRVIFTRWDHLQRDQEADIDNESNNGQGGIYGTFNYTNESADAQPMFAQRSELFPEPRTMPAGSTTNGHRFNFFFPWQCNQDGTEAETMNHVGRHDLAGAYLNVSFTDDPNLSSFVKSYDPNVGFIRQMTLQMRETNFNKGVYYFVDCEENGQNSAGQIMCLTGDPALDPTEMTVSYITHPATKFSLRNNEQPTSQHTGHYRNPLPLSNGMLVVAHSTSNYLNKNIGTLQNPVYLDDFRIKNMVFNGSTWVAGSPLTSGTYRKVTNWVNGSPSTWQGILWEWQPVELCARTMPQSHETQLPSVEAQILQEEGIDSLALRNYLTRKQAAIMVVRDITDRNPDDTHQPYFLRVKGTNKQSANAKGKIYDVSHLQIFQADQIRGKGMRSASDKPLPGRRVLAQPAHDPAFALNTQTDNSVPSGITISPDGSVAAIVPAHRAMTWQITDSESKPIVRERLWVTFQPGEIRVCASCHGGNGTALIPRQNIPQNKPEALRTVLQAIKGHVGTIMAPTLSKPNNRDTNVAIIPIFSWSDNTEASSFHVQISTDSTFSSNTINYTNILKNSFSCYLSSHTAYFWRVRSADLYSFSPWSEVYSFTTQSQNKSNDSFLPKQLTHDYIFITPNPADNTMNLAISVKEDGFYTIECVDITGTKITAISENIFLQKGSTSFNISTSDFANGLYRVIVKNHNFLISYPVHIIH